MTTTEVLASAIADGYWTMCTPAQAVDAFLSDIDGGWVVEVDGDALRFDLDDLGGAIALFMNRSAA